jgi:predicted deacylase
MRPPPRAALPAFPVEIAAPDLRPWLPGNAAVAGFWTFPAAAPGPHVMLTALVHGNEVAGAIVLVRLLAAGIRPLRGRLSLGFVNLDAFAAFDPRDPVASRSVDEDMNRLWCREVLDGPRDSSELRRARAIRPLVDQADILLDLHSLLWPGEPLLLSGRTARGRELAQAIGAPGLVVADEGHAAGRRLIDYRAFADPGGQRTGVLVEGGPHWQRATVEVLADSTARLLRMTGMVDAAGSRAICPTPSPPGPACLAHVTRAVTATTDAFVFVQDWPSGTIIPSRNTLIGFDGEAEVRTPYDNCLLVMPSWAAQKGQTAVRLARLAEG